MADKLCEVIYTLKIHYFRAFITPYYAQFTFAFLLAISWVYASQTRKVADQKYVINGTQTTKFTDRFPIINGM